MSVLKRIGPASAFKIGLVSYAVLGLIAGVVCSLIALTGDSFVPHALGWSVFGRLPACLLLSLNCPELQ